MSNWKYSHFDIHIGPFYNRARLIFKNTITNSTYSSQFFNINFPFDAKGMQNEVQYYARPILNLLNSTNN